VRKLTHDYFPCDPREREENKCLFISVFFLPFFPRKKITENMFFSFLFSRFLLTIISFCNREENNLIYVFFFPFSLLRKSGNFMFISLFP